MKDYDDDIEAGVAVNNSEWKEIFIAALDVGLVFFVVGNLLVTSFTFHLGINKSNFAATTAFILNLVLPCPVIQNICIVISPYFIAKPVYPFATIAYSKLTSQPHKFRHAIALVRGSNILSCLCVSLPWVYLAVLPTDDDVGVDSVVYMSGVASTCVFFVALMTAFKVVSATDSDCSALATTVTAQCVGIALLVIYRSQGRFIFLLTAGVSLLPILGANYILPLSADDITIDYEKGGNLGAEPSKINVRTLVTWIAAWIIVFLISKRFCIIFNLLIESLKESPTKVSCLDCHSS